MKIKAGEAAALFDGEDECGDWILVDDEQIDTRRWVSVNQLVVRHRPTENLFAISYERGLTEYQDSSYPWNNVETDTELDLYPVRASNSVTYVRVKG